MYKGNNRVKEISGHMLEKEKGGTGIPAHLHNTGTDYYQCTICGVIAYMEIDGEWRVSARSAQQQPLEDMSCEDFIIREIIE